VADRLGHAHASGRFVLDLQLTDRIVEDSLDGVSQLPVMLALAEDDAVSLSDRKVVGLLDGLVHEWVPVKQLDQGNLGWNGVELVNGHVGRRKALHQHLDHLHFE